MRIGIWGDSIVYGKCDSEGLGWVGRWRASLFKQDEIEIYNFGVCRDSSEDVLKRFSAEVESISPDLIIISVGLNDAKISTGQTETHVPLDRFKKNIQALLISSQKYTQKIYLLGLTRADDGFIRHTGTRFLNEIIEKYNLALLESARDCGVIFIPMFDRLDPFADLADGLHPNGIGYGKMFNIVNENVKIF
jgi:lysophospholipase L1-like esterase